MFAALYASNAAGPAAIFSWVFGGTVVILLALVHAELGAMFPVAGGSVRYPHSSFGTLVGFTWGWITWLGAVTIAPIEAEAVVTYASNYLDGLTEKTVAGGAAVVMTPKGILIASVLMVIFAAVNLLGVKQFAKTNAALVWLKMIVPFLAVVTLIAVAFKSSNLTAGDGFAPTGIKGVLTAVSAAGVFFALFGFDQAVQLGGESANPKRNVPVAVLGSVFIGTALYILLQVAFLGAVNPADLSKDGRISPSEDRPGPSRALRPRSASPGSPVSSMSTRACHPEGRGSCSPRPAPVSSTA